MVMRRVGTTVFYVSRAKVNWNLLLDNELMANADGKNLN